MNAITNIVKVLYTARVHVAGGRQAGVARSSDGHLDLKLSLPGTNGTGTNPEQLFAAGWAACFEGAVARVAHKHNVTLPEAPTIDAEIDLCQGEENLALRARLNVRLPGIPRDVGEALLAEAHQTCPYSRATRGNIEVSINLV